MNKIPALSIAPMMDWTDRHYRFFMRQITQETLLYTEMITAEAILHGDIPHLLDYSKAEHPLSLQLGGSDPAKLAEAAKIGASWGYDEINLNVGCPSDRVQEGRFGACLMLEPELVARCVAAMQEVVSIPVTVKHRIGVDHHDSYEEMKRFVEIVAETGCERFTVHARIAWLKGLSPKENREVPPLRYEDVYRLKQELPSLWFELNGGVLALDAVEEHLQHVDAVMIGRAAYHDPFVFREVDQRLFGSKKPLVTRVEVMEAMYPYLEAWLQKGGRLHSITRHMMGLWHGLPGARRWRRFLSEVSRKDQEKVLQEYRELSSWLVEVESRYEGEASAA
ncbi:MAG: tRNA dihydrouridine(20/20a) synthase DusA [Myxococcales bacterium]|nr:tRNA dihydrouridine(20/20a) synthase DusA [Myxococcales bacterium]